MFLTTTHSYMNNQSKHILIYSEADITEMTILSVHVQMSQVLIQ